jgi:hypothetical protein
MVLVPEIVTIYGFFFFLKLQLAALFVCGLAVLNKSLFLYRVHLFVCWGN